LPKLLENCGSRADAKAAWELVESKTAQSSQPLSRTKRRSRTHSFLLQTFEVKFDLIFAQIPSRGIVYGPVVD
jgi:hypothetical protein